MIKNVDTGRKPPSMAANLATFNAKKFSHDEAHGGSKSILDAIAKEKVPVVE